MLHHGHNSEQKEECQEPAILYLQSANGVAMSRALCNLAFLPLVHAFPTLMLWAQHKATTHM